MNAWAVMLDLEPLPDPMSTPNDQTYNMAWQVVNWACQGKVDLGTIRALLQCNRFAIAQNSSVIGQYPHDDESTLRMSPDILRFYLQITNAGEANDGVDPDAVR